MGADAETTPKSRGGLRFLGGRSGPAVHRHGIEPLLRAHRAAHPRADLAMLRRAYDVAERLHRDQLRRSGEPFITHPLAVAGILAELGVDTTTWSPRCCTTPSRTPPTPRAGQGRPRRRGRPPGRRA